MALGRPVITRYAEAYRETLADSPIIGWVKPGDFHALAELVADWSRDIEKLKERGKETRKLFELFFGREKTREMLSHMLDLAVGKQKGNWH